MNDRITPNHKNGTHFSFESIFDEYHAYLYAVAYRYLKDGARAEDAVQHTFMRLWENRSDVDSEKNIRNLLFTVMKNYILNYIRHNVLVCQKHYEIAQKNSNFEDDFSLKLEDANLKEHLHMLIDALPPQKREVCVLKVVDGMTNQEIADKMDISVPTVKSHYTQTIKILRSQIGKLVAVMYIVQCI